VSYFEWVQNIQKFRWERDEILMRLDKRMVKSFKDTLEYSKRYETGMRMGALLLAVKRVAEAVESLGIWP